MTAPTPVYFGPAGTDVAPRTTGTKTAAYTAEFGDVVVCDTSGGSFTVTLPPADRYGQVAVRLQAGTAMVTVDGYSTQTIDGSTTTTLAVQGETRVFASQGDGTWVTVAAGGSLAGLDLLYQRAAGDVNTVAASGAAQTIPEPSEYTYSDITLTADCTLTFPGATLGKKLVFVVRQDGTGGWDIVWPTGTIVPGGTLAVTQAASSVDAFEAVSVVEDEWLVYRVGAAFA